MYLIRLLNKDVICGTVDEVKAIPKDSIKSIYSLISVEYDDLVSCSDIRDCIYKFLKGNQVSRDDVLDYVSKSLGVKKTDVSKIITKMKKEKVIYVVEDFDWLGID